MERLKSSLIWKNLEKIQRIILIICSALAVGIIVAAVFMRYVLGTDLYGMEEILAVVAFWLYFIGGAHGSFEKSHIKADIVSVYVKNERIKNTIQLIASLVETTVVIILTSWAYNYFIWGLEKGAKSAGLGIPLVISQGAIFFGLLLMAFYLVVYLIEDSMAFFKKQ